MPVETLNVKKYASGSGNGSAAPEHRESRRDLRSEKIQEIVSDKAGFLIRWGNLFFLVILLFLILACWFVHYPDIIRATAKLTSINAPKPVVTLTNGKLVKLYIRENQQVEKDEILGNIESTASHSEVLALSSDIDSAEAAFSRNKTDQLQLYLNNRYTQLGELQPYYQVFSQSLVTFLNYQPNGFYLKKKHMLVRDLENLKLLHANLISQRALQQIDLDLTQKTFDANESLKSDKVISDFDYRSEQSKLINKKLALPQVNSSIINNENQQNEKQRELVELVNTIDQQRSIFQQALFTFKNQVNEWRRKYFLIAPMNGKVVFASPFQENQQLQANQIICFIHPGNTQYFAEVVIPQANFGKVSVGQHVLLKFASYPFQEFGSVDGQIAFISQIPTESGYSAKVELTHRLITNNGKQIQFREGLVANAEIITQDMRLLERFYYDIVKQLKR